MIKTLIVLSALGYMVYAGLEALHGYLTLVMMVIK